MLDTRLKVHAFTSSRGGNVELRYEPQVTYQYQVLHQAYTGECLTFDSQTYSFEELNKKPHRSQAGESVTVYYDPADPSKSVLEPNNSSGGKYLMLGIICVVCGLGGVLFFYP